MCSTVRKAHREDGEEMIGSTQGSNLSCGPLEWAAPLHPHAAPTRFMRVLVTTLLCSAGPPTSWKALFKEGRQAMTDGRLHQAKAAFAGVLELQPGNRVVQQIMERFSELDIPSDEAGEQRDVVDIGSGKTITLVGRADEAGRCGASLWASQGRCAVVLPARWLRRSP